MTYEEFKKELRWNVQNMETARGKTICLLERHMVCGDPMGGSYHEYYEPVYVWKRTDHDT